MSDAARRFARSRWMWYLLTALLASMLLTACDRTSTNTSQTAPTLRWGGDAEGGAPFVEADPANASIVHGFDVEIASAIATGLGRTPQFVQVSWPSIEQSVTRGDFDVGMSGLEDRPELRARMAVSLPYFEFREVLAVRPADATRFRTLADLAKRRVATLGSTQAYTMLLEAQRVHGVIPVSYDDDVYPYKDLVAGRVDAVLLDHVLADRAMRRTAGFVVQPEPVAIGHYVAVFAPERHALRDSADAILRARLVDGSLERIFRTWGVWDEAQARYQQQLIAQFAEQPTNDTAAGSTGTVASAPRSAGTSPASLTAYLPALLRAAVITLGISLAAMALAMVAGGAIATGRVYGGPVLRAALSIYVEVVRGTPVLLQLFVLYYGLSGVIRLPALVAAILGLGLNYAAYESEIYRSALMAIPRAQLEAARTLGLTEWQVLRLVRGPQALRLALAPMTNDFVALLKDSSLVSVITVVELTKQTAIYATNSGSWVVPGLMCGVIYLCMSLPLSRLARRLEARWST
ncbi:putative amino acid ABC transporter permease/substrate binding protein [Gemmatimonas aurantiaca T-27]|uniref:Putative amino acid ABC transporter permease/substrate binding protein n=1 Tax=Gemmatimonas aurantiaca (strain DSM 14586 / JCM 11422 / NBRC 100505 / T-27) TaxID=379066 RepID=C1ACL6_GEMAT|nr:ABC transporter substrate-binding protein/permease [Gemmatimonas aurantiaca]BAH40243.1 putative amino acid ABC transporter permease/substrate binding protein [Gemmatimonas aurantiaca T-27]